MFLIVLIGSLIVLEEVITSNMGDKLVNYLEAKADM